MCADLFSPAQPFDFEMPNIKVFTGNSNPHLAQAIALRLNIDLSRVSVSKFSNKETWYG